MIKYLQHKNEHERERKHMNTILLHSYKNRLYLVHTRSHIFHFDMYVFCLMHTTQLLSPATTPLNSKRELFFRHKRERERKWIKKTPDGNVNCVRCNASKNIMACWLVERAKFIRLIRTSNVFRNAWHTHTHTRSLIHPRYQLNANGMN